MAYLLARRAPSNLLSPEEDIVLRALGDYCFEPAFTGPLDFCPTSILYARYQEFFRVAAWPPHLRLNGPQFGVALRRIFDIDPARKVRRWHQGEKVNGYLYVQGPGTVQVRATAGRPKR